MKFIVGMTCALALASGVASAGEKTGRITSVHLAQQHVDKVFVQIEGAYTNEPTCSSQVSAGLSRIGGEFAGTVIDATGNQLDTAGRAKTDCAAFGAKVAGC